MIIFMVGYYKVTMNIQAYPLQDDIVCVRIREESTVSSTRVPVHFAIVLDNSGSMAVNSKLSHVKKSLYYIINMLTSDDVVSLITFSDDSKTVSPRMAMTAEGKVILQQRLKHIRAEGGTNISAGIIKTREELLVGDGHKQGILLLTDGQANFGIQDVEGMNGLIRSLAAEFPGTTISSVGYGTDHNSDLLRGISSEGSGSYSVVENLENVATVFGDILGGLASCAFQQITVQVPVGSQQITQLPSDASGILRVGDIHTQDEVTILLRGMREGDEVKVQGYDIRGLTFVNHSVRVAHEASAEMLRHGRIAKLRVDVTECMNMVRNVMLRQGGGGGERVGGGGGDNGRARASAQIDELCGKIQTERTAHGDSSLLNFLLEELAICTNTLALDIRSYQENCHATQILTQHMSVITTGRGISSNATPGRPSDPAPNTSHLQPVFSNGLQRHISSGLRTQTSQWMEDSDSEDSDEDPIASMLLPMRSLPIRSVSGYIGTPSEVSPVNSDNE